MIRDNAADREALEIAYGLLWLVSIDRSTRNGEAIYQARQALLGRLDREAKLRGLRAAQDALGAPGKDPRP